MEVEGVIARAPSLRALLLSVCDLLRLALDTGLHDMIFANSTVVNVDVPCPESNGIPLLYHKSRLGSSFNHFYFWQKIWLKILFCCVYKLITL